MPHPKSAIMPGLQHLLTNPFLSATKESAVRAATLGTFTDAALGRPGQSAEIVALYNEYHPVYEAFITVFGGKDTASGLKVGKVQGMRQRLAELSRLIAAWARRIENVHEKGTEQYIALLPNGRKPFRNGKVTTRLVTVRTLANALLAEPELADLQAEVDAFATLLEGMRIAVEGKKVGNKSKSVELERARVALCEALYAVAGGLIRLYPSQPKLVASYFDVATLRRHRHRKNASEEAS